MFKRLRHVLRVFARSRSWRFATDVAQARTLARAGVRGLPLAKLSWRGRDIFYRPGTSDPLRPQPGHLYWPELDVDLSVESIEHPERYPLKAKDLSR